MSYINDNDKLTPNKQKLKLLIKRNMFSFITHSLHHNISYYPEIKITFIHQHVQL